MQKYYSSPSQLKDGPHQLVITSLMDGPLLSLDFAQYLPSSKQVPSAPLSNNSRAGVIAAGIIGSVASLIVIVLLIFLIRYRRRRGRSFVIEDGDHVDISKLSEPYITPFRQAQSGPPVAWSSKSGNMKLPTTRPKRHTILSIEPPEYDQAIDDHHLGRHPLTAQSNVYGRRRSLSEPHIYHAEDFDVLPISM